jgi:hypothetical protein
MNLSCYLIGITTKKEKKMKKKTKQKIMKVAVALFLAFAPGIAQTVVEKLIGDDPAPQITVIVIKK